MSTGGNTTTPRGPSQHRDPRYQRAFVHFARVSRCQNPATKQQGNNDSRRPGVYATTFYSSFTLK